jgi:hypothetical protein
MGLLDLFIYGGAAYGAYTIYDKLFPSKEVKTLDDYKNENSVSAMQPTLLESASSSVRGSIENYIPEILPYYYGSFYSPEEIADMEYIESITEGNFKFYSSFIDYLKEEHKDLYSKMSTTQRYNIMSYKSGDLLKYYKPISYLLGISEDESFKIVSLFLEMHNA